MVFAQILLESILPRFQAKIVLYVDFESIRLILISEVKHVEVIQFEFLSERPYAIVSSQLT